MPVIIITVEVGRHSRKSAAFSIQNEFRHDCSQAQFAQFNDQWII
jgi:hypothetical protein